MASCLNLILLKRDEVIFTYTDTFDKMIVIYEGTCEGRNKEGKLMANFQKNSSVAAEFMEKETDLITGAELKITSDRFVGFSI